MIHAWYEKMRDEKDHIYFAYRKIADPDEIPRGTRFPGFHNSIEFAFGLKGRIRIAVSGRTYSLHEGEVCFMNSLEPHRYYYEYGSECYVVLISSSFFTEANRLGSISFPTHSGRCEGFEKIKDYLDYASDVWDGDSFLCKSAFADTIAYLMAKYYVSFPKKEMEKQTEVLLRAVKYICEHCTEQLTVGGVAKRFGYSANYFSTAFNEFMGAGFPEFLNICRMIEYNRIHREQPEIPVYRVAEMCGFLSMNTFYRALGRTTTESRRTGPVQEKQS